MEICKTSTPGFKSGRRLHILKKTESLVTRRRNLPFPTVPKFGSDKARGAALFVRKLMIRQCL